MSRRRALAVLALALLGLRCGYRLAGRGGHVPDAAQTISIEMFTNRTREKGLEVALQRAIDQEFRRRGALEVVPESDGDLVLSGTIRRFTTTAVALGATGEALQFQAYLLVSLKLTERATGRVVYQNRDLAETTDFGAVSGVVVTGSPRFQDETINARDLVDFTNVQIGESRRRAALNELLTSISRSVYLQSVEAF
jgi:hypothetical protein